MGSMERSLEKIKADSEAAPEPLEDQARWTIKEMSIGQTPGHGGVTVEFIKEEGSTIELTREVGQESSRIP